MKTAFGIVLLLVVNSTVFAETLFTGRKKIETSWKVCLLAEKSIQQNSGVARITVRFQDSSNASGALLLDGKQVLLFEDTFWARYHGALSAGKHSFEVRLSKPAVMTELNVEDGIVLCPE